MDTNSKLNKFITDYGIVKREWIRRDTLPKFDKAVT